MTATGHAIIGTVIAAKIGDPLLAAPLALASHFLADALPHWDTGYHREQKSKTKFFIQSVADVAVGFAASYALIVAFFPGTNLAYAFFMILVAQAPDWLTAPYLFLDMKFAPFSWFYKTQKLFDTHLGMPWGFINQVAIVSSVIIFGRVF
ncbi:MAG: hypothetical protein A2171_01065 [Candidatus Levybacteria bacterium RBG_13_35_9]|nr:MAG: hypothetical protein A2171_01065 [Candidatus Levybacteria bacterium RBG_13_35_9]